jgi:AcrR family transcriptional regulator
MAGQNSARSFVPQKAERPIANIASMSGRRTDEEARATRAAILDRAADIASAEGLEGITIGRLASELKMSKSGVVGQFGTKEELQLATLQLAAAVFRERVWEPVEALEPGLPRLLGICRAWTDYAREPGFSGGCFIAHVSFEFDGRAGRVHDELARIVRSWRRRLVREIERAVERGELSAELDAEQVAFSLDALASGITPARRLHGDGDAATRSLAAMHAVLGVAPPA